MMPVRYDVDAFLFRIFLFIFVYVAVEYLLNFLLKGRRREAFSTE